MTRSSYLGSLVILALALRGRRRDMAVPLSAFAVSLIALMHSSIDFSLQVAGYSIVVFALLGMGLAQAVGQENRRNLRSEPGADLRRMRPPAAARHR